MWEGCAHLALSMESLRECRSASHCRPICRAIDTRCVVVWDQLSNSIMTPLPKTQSNTQIILNLTIHQLSMLASTRSNFTSSKPQPQPPQ